MALCDTSRRTDALEMLSVFLCLSHGPEDVEDIREEAVATGSCHPRSSLQVSSSIPPLKRTAVKRRMWSNATGTTPLNWMSTRVCVCEIWEGLCAQISDSDVQCATDRCENDWVVIGNVRVVSKCGRAVDMFPPRPFQGRYLATLKVCGTCTDSLLCVAVPWLCVTPQVPYTSTGHPPSQGGMTLNILSRTSLFRFRKGMPSRPTRSAGSAT